MSYPTELIKTCRNKILDLREHQKKEFAQGADISELLSQASSAVDQVLINLWQHFIPESNPKDSASLIATGGYGRRELHPGSDIDLMILLPKKHPRELETAIAEFLTVLWDIGLEIGHSVRTQKETIAACKGDITIATSLQEARLIIGDTEQYDLMLAATGPKKIWPSKEFFQAKFEEQHIRHHRYRDTAYNLEPNIKGNIGGLRDIQVIAWVLKRHFDADYLYELVDLDFLTQQEYDDLDTAKRFLWKIRFALHCLNNGREDRLLFDSQIKIAEQLGYIGTDSRKPVELFMRDYYRSALTVSRLNWMFLQMFREHILETKKPVIKKIDQQLQIRNEYLDITDEEAFEKDPSLILRLFSVWQQNVSLRGITALTNRKLHEALHYIDESFRNNSDNKKIFLSFFNTPTKIYNTLARMNRHGVLGRFMPSFGEIVGHMQFDMFHAYTVDAHILFVIKEIENLLTNKNEDEHINEIVASLSKPNILILSGLFHDIAKGRDGDHSTLGAADVLKFGKAFGLSEKDIELLSFLVDRHLILSITAQKKDIDDPAVIAEFADIADNKRKLKYLYLLTIADVKGTNPALWNQWKAVLFAKLYKYTLNHFENLAPNTQEHIESKKHAALKQLSKEYPVEDIKNTWSLVDDEYFLRHSPGEIRWHTRVLQTEKKLPIIAIRKQRTGHLSSYNENKALDLFVASVYDSQLFTKVCVALDDLNLDIYNAKLFRNKRKIQNQDTVALTFRVRETNSDILIDDNRKDQINATIKSVLKSDEKYRLPKPKVTRQMRAFSSPTKVTFGTDPSDSYTTIEVKALDRQGLLAMISYCFAECDIDITLAKITTLGERAEDVFYISDNKQQKLNSEQQKQLSKKIHEILD